MKYSILLSFLIPSIGLAQLCAPNRTVVPTSKLQDSLGAASCLQPDGTPYAGYRITFPAVGTWTASITAADGVTPYSITLRDQSGLKIASGSSISQTIERGSYRVIVNGAAGAFTLTSAFAAVPNILCQQFPSIGSGPATAPRQTQGTLGQGSCTLPDGSVYDGYQITLYGAGTLDVAMTSTFTPLLILRTADGHSLQNAATPDASGVVHLNVPKIGNDTYTLIAAVSSPDQTGGPYTLSATFTPDSTETCISAATLTASQQLNGSITNASCDFNLPGRADFAPFNFYGVHLDQAGAVQITLDAADFSALLLLLDADGNPIASDIESGPSGTPLIRQQLPAGDYRLVIFNEEPFGGNYALNYQYTAGNPPGCTVSQLVATQAATGILGGATSCKDGALLADAYQIVLPSDGTLAISLSSHDFTTYLDLHDAKDNALTWGIHRPDGSASSLTADLPAGTYYVYSATEDVPGGYALSYTFTPKTLVPCPQPASMPPNGYIHAATLGSSSCQGPDGRVADYYQFTLGVPATEAIFETSQDILPDLALLDQNGVPLRRDQKSYVGNNSLIVQYLPAGTYQIRARSADPTLSGRYNLDLFYAPGAPPALCAPRTLPLNGTVQDLTSVNSCIWYDKTFATIYRIDVPSGPQTLDVSCLSAAFDTFLVLLDSKGDILAADDNSGGGTNARLVQILDAGSYFLVVKPSSDPSQIGPYSVISNTQPVPVSSSK